MRTAHPGRREALRLITLGGFAQSLLCHARSAPSSSTIPQDRLQSAANYCKERKTQAFLVIQNGSTLHESYFNGAKRGDPRRIYSGTKGFWGLAALAAAEEGLFKLDEPVSDTITEWKGQGGKSSITIRQLLQFNSGLERCLALHEDGLTNRNTMAIGRPLVGTPGRSFIYGPSSLQVFHELFKRKLARRKRPESPTRYLERKVLGPMGLGSQRYLPDKSGNPLLAAGFLMTANQWSRMGKLLLRKGSPIIGEGSFSSIRKGSSANAAYSFGFWNNQAAGSSGAHEFDIEDMLEVPWERQSWSRACICRDAPSDLIACIGSGYQRLYAIPSMDLIVIRQGSNARYSDGNLLRILLGRA